MTQIEPTDRTRLRRAAARGSYDRDLIYSILDTAPLCHVAAVDGDLPVVRPMVHWRVGEMLYLHTARAGQLARLMAKGATISVSATLLDGFVLARSAFSHSVNYRSVTLFGAAAEVTDITRKEAVLAALVERIAPGRNALLRPMTKAERDATLVVGIPIAEASAKARSGPPGDGETDAVWPVWAGVIPMRQHAVAPVPAPGLDPALPPVSELGPWAGDEPAS